MTEQMLVGVDVGTTRLKAVAVGLGGDELATTSTPTPWVIDGDKVEMDAGVLAERAREVVAGVVGRSGGRMVAGVGVTGMGESGVLLDERGGPVAPVIAWYDQRGDVDRVLSELPDLPVRTGVPRHPTATVFKLALTATSLRGHRWLNVPEWVVRSFGGDEFAEMSLAGRTGMQDLHNGRWWADALALLGTDETLFPGEARLGTDGAGRATFPSIAGATLAVGGHDHQVAAFAVGATEPGCLFESLGTADALTVAVRPPVAEPTVAEVTAAGATIGRTVVPDRLMAMAGLRTGQILGRIGRLVGVAAGPERRALSATAAALDLDTRLTFSLDDGALTIGGIGDDTGPEQLWRAAVAAADGRSSELSARYVSWFGAADRVVVGGGWLHDPAVEMATMQRFPGAARTRFAEPGAVGAAAIAGIAAGVIDAPFVDLPTERTAS